MDVMYYYYLNNEKQILNYVRNAIPNDLFSRHIYYKMFNKVLVKKLNFKLIKNLYLYSQVQSISVFLHYLENVMNFCIRRRLFMKLALFE